MNKVINLSRKGAKETWNRQRWHWQKLVMAEPNLSPSAKLTACALVSQFSDHETGACSPSQSAIAEALATSERTIRRAISDLEQAGFLRRETTGRKGANTTLKFLFQGDVVTISGQPSAVSIAQYERPKADKSDRLTHKQRRSNLATQADKSGHPPIPPYKDTKLYPKKTQSERPRPDLSVLISKSGFECADWNEWLAKNGHPPLDSFADQVNRDGKCFFDVPYRIPPTDIIAVSIVQKRIAWSSQANGRML